MPRFADEPALGFAYHTHMWRALLSIVLVACYLPPMPAASRPRPSYETLDEPSRIEFYRKYRLTAAREGLGTALARDDGKHTYIDLRDVLGEYPRSRMLYQEAALRDSVLVSLLVGGLSFGVMAGADQLAATGNSAMLTQTGRDVLYSFGGALLVATAITAWLWNDPIARIPETYNDELRADLGLR